MKTFYAKLKKAEQSDDVRMAKLAKVCKADLKNVQQNQVLEDWTWWTG